MFAGQIYHHRVWLRSELFVAFDLFFLKVSFNGEIANADAPRAEFLVQLDQCQARFGSESRYDPVVLFRQPGETISTHRFGCNASGPAKPKHPLTDRALA